MFISTSGTCWPSSPRTPRPELLLGWPGLDLQVLRGHPHRPLPQGHQEGPQDQLDHEAVITQGSHPRWKIIQRIGQGPQVHPEEGRFPQRRLAPQELAQASPQALKP